MPSSNYLPKNLFLLQMIWIYEIPVNLYVKYLTQDLEHSLSN